MTELTSCKKEERVNLKKSELSKLQDAAEEGIKDKFALFDAVNLEENKSLQSLYSITMRIDNLRTPLVKYDMNKILHLPTHFKKERIIKFNV